jgi:hypothetical protein
MTEVVLHDAYGVAWMRDATQRLAEPTSNTVRSVIQRTAQWTQAADLIGANIFLWYPGQPYISFSFNLNEFRKTFGRTLIENALIHALAVEGRATTIPQQVSLLWRDKPETGRTTQNRRRTQLQDRTTAQLLLAKIQSRSELTLEEIAPLLGVSRRSLQNWRAQRQISARKEQRLRDLADALDALPIGDARQTRRMLFDRIPGNVRPYDLLAEGRFDAAYSMMTGSPAPTHLVTRTAKPTVPPAPSVSARLSIHDDGPPFPSGRIDLGRSRRLKR